MRPKFFPLKKLASIIPCYQKVKVLNYWYPDEVEYFCGDIDGLMDCLRCDCDLCNTEVCHFSYDLDFNGFVIQVLPLEED